MYIYPDNLKAKATMWLWSLKDLAIVGIIILFSVFAFAYAGDGLGVLTGDDLLSRCIFEVFQ
jgi:hypothetical protein